MEEGKIKELEFKPKTDKKRVFPIFFITLAVAGVLVILSVTAELYRGLISLGAVVFICTALYFYARYIAVDFIYSVIINTEGEAVFLVNKVAGKRSSLMYMTYLFNVESIKRFTKDGENKYKRDKNAKEYNFMASYAMKDFYILRSKSHNETAEVRLEFTDELARLISEYSQEARREYESRD